MIPIFYIAALVAILASAKVVSSRNSMSALLYFVVSSLATAVLFFTFEDYFSASLVVILSVGAISLLFLTTLSLLNIKNDNVEISKKGISPKIWLGPLILVFVLLVILVYCILTSEYFSPQIVPEKSESIIERLLGAYILVIELAILLLLGALVVSYHFIYPSINNSNADGKTVIVTNKDK